MNFFAPSTVIRYISLVVRLIASFSYFLIFSKSNIASIAGFAMLFSFWATLGEHYSRSRSFSSDNLGQRHISVNPSARSFISATLSCCLQFLFTILFFPPSSLVREFFSIPDLLLLSSIPFLQFTFYRSICQLRNSFNPFSDLLQYLLPPSISLSTLIVFSFAGFRPSSIYVWSMVLALLVPIILIRSIRVEHRIHSTSSTRIVDHQPFRGGISQKHSSSLQLRQIRFISITSALTYSFPSLTIALAARLPSSSSTDVFISCLFLALKLGDLFTPLFGVIENDFPFEVKKSSFSSFCLSILQSKVLTDFIIHAFRLSFCFLIAFLISIYFFLSGAATLFPTSSAAQFLGLQSFAFISVFVSLFFYTAFLSAFDPFAIVFAPQILLLFDCLSLSLFIPFLSNSIFIGDSTLMSMMIFASSMLILLRRLFSFFLVKHVQRVLITISSISRSLFLGRILA